jgi:hypothetical protein
VLVHIIVKHGVFDIPVMQNVVFLVNRTVILEKIRSESGLFAPKRNGPIQTYFSKKITILSA